MREIKFRVWIPSEKRWLDEPIIEFPNGKAYPFSDTGDDWEKHMYEVMQFTGLKDKNGKEIYEGDIVKTEHIFKDIIGYIKYEVGMFIIASDSYEDSYAPLSGYSNSEMTTDEVEVIGNIYQNPELLK